MTTASIKSKTVRFAHPEKESFSKELRKRVSSYFKENNISKKGNRHMVVKTVAMLALYFVPYTLMLVFNFGTPLIFLTFLVMGFGMSGVGMGVMHDAVHGAYHSKKKVNSLLGSTMYLISGNVATWRVQHNVLHHTYTNIEGMDEDLETSGLIRLHPSQPWRKMHRLQAWYAPFLYGLLTLNWVVMKDFKQLIRYKRRGITGLTDQDLRKEWVRLVLTKSLYFFLFPVLPLLLLSAPWYVIVLGFVLMHFTAGFVLSFIFQLAHAVEGVETFDPPENGKMDDAWMEHQMQTTANFARNSKFVSWFVGGLNFQIEHHLFPNICHVHYPELSRIVENTAREFGLPYQNYASLRDAVKAHMSSLRSLAHRPALA